MASEEKKSRVRINLGKPMTKSGSQTEKKPVSRVRINLTGRKPRL
ncbi:hypothetical protein [Streptomyces sp. NBC_01483]|nr:hypothetical protein [Streptomyces sp. NBC_01483]